MMLSNNKSDPARLSCRVLYVDDDPNRRRMLEFSLVRAGAKVAFECDGQAVLLAITSSPPADVPFDVVRTVADLPLLDGCAATRKLREQGYMIPVIALVPGNDDHRIRQCLQAGCTDVLKTPVSTSDVLQMVRKYAME